MEHILDEEKKIKTDRMLEIFFRALKGEKVSLKKFADEYHVSTKSIRRDINSIQSFLAEHRELLNHAEFEYSYHEKAFVMKSDEFLLNKELFALVKIILGSRCFNKDDVLSIIAKLKKFITIHDREKFEAIVRKELYHYHEVKSDCNTVIDNLWKIIQCIDEKQMITITYYKMNRNEVKHKIKPVSIMFSEYYFYLIAYESEDENYKPIYFRIDRIANMMKHKEHFQLDREHDFAER